MIVSHLMITTSILYYYICFIHDENHQDNEESLNIVVGSIEIT